MKKSKVEILVCPECESDSVTVTEQQMFMVNTLEHYCHSVKAGDAEAESSCLDCGWRGIRKDLRPFA